MDSASQYNKIVPLPSMTNAPFEQTFRITVLLPRDQLYVTRIGAKTKLEKLLELVCADKLLDKNKYDFRHPGKIRACLMAGHKSNATSIRKHIPPQSMHHIRGCSKFSIRYEKNSEQCAEKMVLPDSKSITHKFKSYIILFLQF